MLAHAVTRDVTAVALLAPGATRGDSRIGGTALRTGNVASLGGASPAENVYYINGFNLTNNLNGVAFNHVPFEGIAQQQACRHGLYSFLMPHNNGALGLFAPSKGESEKKKCA